MSSLQTKTMVGIRHTQAHKYV